MDEQPAVNHQPTKASPWPLFVALGLPLSEIGVVFGWPPVAIGGLLLFSGSIVGILRESGYAATLSAPSFWLGSILGVLGSAVILLTDVPLRGVYVAGTGAFLLLAAGVLWLWETGRL